MRRQGANGGSVLLVAVFSLLVASLLALGAAASLRSSWRRVSMQAERARNVRMALDCAATFAKEVLACDTNGIDCIGEEWTKPLPGDTDPLAAHGGQLSAKLEPEFPEVDFAPCVDEESRYPINSATVETLASLIVSVGAAPPKDAVRLASAIVAGVPYPRREFLMLVPGVDEEVFRLLAPYTTAASSGAININTAPAKVLDALFAAASASGSSAAASLSAKFLALRKGGGHLESLDDAVVGEVLGGLNQAEYAAFSAMRQHLCVESRHFSGAAKCGGRRLVFTYDRKDGVFTRIAY